MRKYKRMFVIVVDSLGVGAMRMRNNLETSASIRWDTLQEKQREDLRYRTCKSLAWQISYH